MKSWVEETLKVPWVSGLIWVELETSWVYLKQVFEEGIYQILNRLFKI
jgi:hypothetical protein